MVSQKTSSIEARLRHKPEVKDWKDSFAGSAREKKGRKYSQQIARGVSASNYMDAFCPGLRRSALQFQMGIFSTVVTSQSFTCLKRKPSSWQPTTYLMVCDSSVCSQFVECRRTLHSHTRLIKVCFAFMQDLLVLLGTERAAVTVPVQIEGLNTNEYHW